MNETSKPEAREPLSVTGKVAGATFGYVLIACGLFLWIVAVPVTIAELVQHIKLTDEAGLMVLALIGYGAISGFGALLVRSVLGKHHLAARVTTWIYLILLGLGILTALVVNSK